MRVLHLFKTYLPESFTGIERVIWQIAEGTAPLGVQTDVLSLGHGDDRTPMRIGQHTAHTAKQDFYIASTGLSLSVFNTFAELAADVDIVHYHFPWPLMDLIHLFKNNKPTVVTYHSDVVRQKTLLQLYRPLMYRFLDRADRIVATSPNYAQSSEVLPRYSEKTSVIPIGLDDFTPIAADRLARWKNQLGGRFFLFLGVLRYYKGLPFLLEAARASGLPVVVAGSGDLQNEIERAGLPNVTLLGQVEEADKEALLTLCTAFVFPSHLRSEAFGIALLEAARAGKALISCEIGTGMSYINLDGETGYVVPPADPVALAGAMQKLWDNPVETVAMGQRARRRYEEVFTAKQMSASYFALYNSLLEEKRLGLAS